MEILGKIHWRLRDVGWKLLLTIGIIFIVFILLVVTTISLSSSGSEKLRAENAALIHPEPQAVTPNLWPSARVPYTIEQFMLDSDTKSLIQNALQIFEKNTCIRFVNKTNSDENWLLFIRNDDQSSASDLGLNESYKGSQKVQFGLDWFTASTVQQTIGRALGLEFEEIRPDRNKFIELDNEKCSESLPPISKSHNEAALEIYFDYTSHMFNSIKCFKALYPGEIIFGSQEGSALGMMSVLDIEKLNAIYNCPGCNSFRFRSSHIVTENPVHSFESFNPVHAGHDIDTIPLYICRVYHNGSIVIGKLKMSHEEDICWIAHNGKEYRYSRKYEVLTNPKNVTLTWQNQTGSTIPTNAIRGGRTVDRQTLFIGRCELKIHDNITSIIPSHVFPGIDGISVPFGYVARTCSTYEILVCNK